jgi:cyclopropane fatty-acyl-phospholipid synthase-like methyltransferase
VRYYARNLSSLDPALRECACHCVAELAAKVDPGAVGPHAEELLALLVRATEETGGAHDGAGSWGVRDAAVVALGKLLVTFQASALSPESRAAAVHCFLRLLTDPVRGVRDHAAMVIGLFLAASAVETTTAAATATAAAAAAPAAPTSVELVFKSTLEEAQLRKLDHLIARANVQKTDRVLDLGFGWGGLSIRLAETVGCRVVGITLSKEQHDLALERVRARGLDHLITFEIVDYRVFAAAHPGEFDRIISVEMIEAVGANYFGEYMAALDRLLAPQGLIVIQAITMPESRYETYIHTTDFINTIIFPGGCCPSLAAVTGAMMKGTNLLLTSVDQFNVHYGETLRRWRANFNAVLADVVRPLGFDDAFIRTWNYYLCYCEAGFSTQTLGLQVLTFMRPNTQAVIVGRPAGRLAEPIGPFVNDDDAPVLVPAGTW